MTLLQCKNKSNKNHLIIYQRYCLLLRRTVEKEIKEMGKTWEGIKFMARDRQMWREHVAALHAC